MERLTKKSDEFGGMVWFASQDKEGLWLEPCEMSYHDNRTAIDCLAAYEDTGLEPKEIMSIINGCRDIDGHPDWQVTLFGKTLNEWLALARTAEGGGRVSLLIKGMEMPTSCGDCKAFVCYRQWAGDVGDCFCGITKNDAKAKEKNADCPLVPVPTGRLINADALIKKLGVGDLPIRLTYEIRNAPTIIEAEEVKDDG